MGAVSAINRGWDNDADTSTVGLVFSETLPKIRGKENPQNYQKGGGRRMEGHIFRSVRVGGLEGEEIVFRETNVPKVTRDAPARNPWWAFDGSLRGKYINAHTQGDRSWMEVFLKWGDRS